MFQTCVMKSMDFHTSVHIQVAAFAFLNYPSLRTSYLSFFYMPFFRILLCFVLLYLRPYLIMQPKLALNSQWSCYSLQTAKAASLHCHWGICLAALVQMQHEIFNQLSLFLAITNKIIKILYDPPTFFLFYDSENISCLGVGVFQRPPFQSYTENQGCKIKARIPTQAQPALLLCTPGFPAWLTVVIAPALHCLIGNPGNWMFMKAQEFCPKTLNVGPNLLSDVSSAFNMLLAPSLQRATGPPVAPAAC